MNIELPKLNLPRLSGMEKTNLIFSTSRRFNLFQNTIETLIKFNPNL